MLRVPVAIMLACLLGACQPAPHVTRLEGEHDKAVTIMHDSPPEALRVFKETCDGGYATACANAAWLMLDAGLEDASSAVAYYEKSCRLGAGIGCNNLANLYAEGVLVPVDDPKAFDYIRKACDLGYATACYRAGYITLLGKLTKHDMNKVRAYYQRACNLGDVIGCYDLGYLHLNVHRTPVPKQAIKAYNLFEMGCREQRFMRACTTQGYLLLHGEDGVKKDRAQAKELFRKACAADEPFACNNLASMYEDGSAGAVNNQLAARFYLKACQLSKEFCSSPEKAKIAPLAE